MPEGYAIMPDLPGMDFLATANHVKNINNGDYLGSPYAFPGYVG